jgi:hypothetical protein
MCCVAHHHSVATVRDQRCSFRRWHLLHCPSVLEGHMALWQSGGTVASCGILCAVSAPQVRPVMVPQCLLEVAGQWVPSVARLHP